MRSREEALPAMFQDCLDNITYTIIGCKIVIELRLVEYLSDWTQLGQIKNCSYLIRARAKLSYKCSNQGCKN